MSIFVLSLDLGQVQDYTALVISEVRGTTEIVSIPQHHELIGMPVPRATPIEIPPIIGVDIRHIERFPLNTKYQTIARMVEARWQATPKPKTLVLDETGVGIGVIEMFMHLRPYGITITAGKEATCPLPGRYHVPKRDLVASLQVRVQNGTVKIARGLPHAELLMREMLAFRAKISAAGHDTYEAWREQEHDDLVLAAAMSTWMGEECMRIQKMAVQDAILTALTPREYQISPI